MASPQNRNVADRRHSSVKSIEDFPTPPWGTRALVAHVFARLGISLKNARVWEPAAGRGIMAEVLREYGADVYASDVHRYPDQRGRIDAYGSFTGEGLDVIARPGARFDHVITNPPYNAAEKFLDRALGEARFVSMLLRTAFVDSEGRYRRIYRERPPIVVAQFAERCPMHEGGWQPDGDTLTPYAWFVWDADRSPRRRPRTELMWIPDGQREALERPTDRARFARHQEAML